MLFLCVCQSHRPQKFLTPNLLNPTIFWKFHPFGVPVIIQSFMSRCWPHFTNTCSKWICVGPTTFNLFSTCPPDPFHQPDGKFVATWLTMAIYVPAWYRSINLRSIRYSHMLRELLHPLI